ncbi:ABC transporter ATP-binding protein/permease [Paracrocinitomix mangrovi]|uniref:ABC transporter ATP-binding protein n=1 Tax=Paracrocinitomix mangrovi TaxID=2862509 RepID=UPI001C8D4C82|nr:ABC transporter ATP-binding protein [Paracrocinitomix mangrovi]UKN02472.1 ABC transporter ATP-binding protein/permease [Paracrocinitomix mangrovi]
MSEEKKKFNFDLAKRLFNYFKEHPTVSISSLIIIVLMAFIGVAQPLMIKEMVNRFVIGEGADASWDGVQQFMYTIQPDTDVSKQLWTWTIFVIILLFLEGFLTFFSTYLGALLGQSIIRDMRIRLYKHLNSFNLKYFDRTPNGVVVTRMVSDIEAVAEVFSTGFINILGDLIRLIVILGAMLAMSWELTLLTLIPIPLLIISTRIFARAMKLSFQKERTQVTKLNTFVQEHISGMTIVQLFSRSKREAATFRVINADHRQAHLDAILANSIFFPVVELLASLSIAAVIFWSILQLDGGKEAIAGTYGVIFAFILLIYKLYRPIRQMADRFNILQRGMVRAERVFEILDRQEHIDDNGTLTDVDFAVPIDFNDIWFAYNDEDWVLKGITMRVEPGQSVALVGATGAGKSTIINLLTRFYEFQKGELKIGDHSIRDIELNTLRKSVAVVLQDVFLFSDTIYNNITLRDESISRERVEEAAKKVGAHDFIMSLPGGYDYNVRERGGVLSVGQKQLISFIRAYVYDPKILILDEATASVDSESEEMIQKATSELQKGRTSIIIAHRLSTIVNSDKIVVINDGKILESGTHQELLDKGGQYKKLYELNFS